MVEAFCAWTSERDAPARSTEMSRCIVLSGLRWSWCCAGYRICLAKESRPAAPVGKLRSHAMSDEVNDSFVLSFIE